MTLKEVRQMLLGALPPGLSKALGPDLQLILEGIAAALKQECADLLDKLRKEINPATCTELLPEWEVAFSLTETAAAKYGSTTARQNQVLAAWRQNAPNSIPSLRALMQPFFLYADPDQIQVLETDRAALKTAHTYGADASGVNVPVGFPGGGTNFWVIDDGPVADAGAQLSINIDGWLEELTFTLTGPDGASQQAFWDVGFVGSGQVVDTNFVLYAPRDVNFGTPTNPLYVRGNTLGRWRLQVVSRGPHTARINGASLFVEAVGLNARGGEGLGSVMHEFAIVADPALLGIGNDLDAARRVLLKNRPAWTGSSIVKKNPVMGGGLLAIPDEPTTLPDASIPS